MSDNKEQNCCGCGCEEHSGTGENTSSCCSEEHGGAESCGCGCGDAGLPAPTFSTFVLSLASSCLVNLGEVPDPATGKQEANLPLAQHTIDLLNMLQEKIQKGLDEEENNLLEGVLYELRMKFVLKK